MQNFMNNTFQIQAFSELKIINETIHASVADPYAREIPMADGSTTKLHTEVIGARGMLIHSDTRHRHLHSLFDQGVLNSFDAGQQSKFSIVYWTHCALADQDNLKANYKSTTKARCLRA